MPKKKGIHKATCPCGNQLWIVNGKKKWRKEIDDETDVEEEKPRKKKSADDSDDDDSGDDW